MAIVYVVESGVYEQRHIVAIYDSAERAMAAYPRKWERRFWCSWDMDLRRSDPNRFTEEWECDDDDNTTITPYIITDSGPLSGIIVPIIKQRYVSDMEWAYDQISEDDIADLQMIRLGRG